MSKEINEQNITAKACINEYVDKLRKDINLYNFPIIPQEIEKSNFDRLWNSLSFMRSQQNIGLRNLQTFSIETDVASEFRYRKIKFNKKNLYMFSISVR